MPTISLGPHDPTPVATAIATRGAEQFFRALWWVEAKTRGVATRDLPGPLRMIRVVCYLDLEREDGILRFFSHASECGPHTLEMARFGRSIGATRTAEYLERTVSLLPDGELPESHGVLNATAVMMRDREPFHALDHEFRTARTELATRLRPWLRANRVEVERLMLETAAARDAAKAPVKKARAKAGGKTSAKTSAKTSGTTGAKRAKRAKSTPSPLDAILAEPGEDLIVRLADWVWTVPGRLSIPVDSLPVPARMILQLQDVWFALEGAGLLYLLDRQAGDDHAATLGWLRTIGARRTIAYLDAYAALFPDGRVPATADERNDALFPERSDTMYDVFDPLDAEYREDAVAEMPARLHDYFVAHRTRIEREMSTMAAAAPGDSPDDVLVSDSNPLAGFARMRTLYARYVAEGKADRLPPAVVRVGDVVEVRHGRLRVYVQATHAHAFARSRGPVVRVLPGTFRTRPDEAALRALVAGPAAFVTIFHADSAMNNGEAEIVGRRPVPRRDAAFPPFLVRWGKTRDGRTVWGEWRGDDEPASLVPGPLTPAQRERPIVRVNVDAETLVQETADGWTPAVEYASWGER